MSAIAEYMVQMNGKKGKRNTCFTNIYHREKNFVSWLIKERETVIVMEFSEMCGKKYHAA